MLRNVSCHLFETTSRILVVRIHPSPMEIAAVRHTITNFAQTYRDQHERRQAKLLGCHHQTVANAL